jgi:FKBP-type peptidyl-prolyl cis-trans isomerase FklB
MMKKLYLLPIVLFALAFAACDESEEVDRYANWRERNEAFIDSLAQDKSLPKIEDERNKGSFIYYKVLETGPTTTETINGEDVILPLPPFYTSSVTMFYKGMYINGDIFDKNFSGESPTEFNSPSPFRVNQVITGWTEILQRMRPGDRFKVYIPYKSGYGTTTSTSKVPAYSTLIFDMKMVSIEY